MMKARLDADRTAKPLTRLVKHVAQGACVGPFTQGRLEHESEDGTRTPLQDRETGRPATSGFVAVRYLYGAVQGMATCEKLEEVQRDALRGQDRIYEPLSQAYATKPEVWAFLDGLNAK